MQVEIIPCLENNYSYLIIDDSNNSACVVDPSEADPIINFLENKNINLKYILNTHHHFDHIGGNKELKKKFKSLVVGFKGDSSRIPGIDICLKDKEIWKSNDFEAKIFHIPGHTSGHICISFFKQKILFTGDTLFSLGCGRVFEGTYEQMLNSLNLIKSFPKDTKIYCGHEYTKNNYDFCNQYEHKNKFLEEKYQFIKSKLDKNIPTIPVTLLDELNTNIFLRCDNHLLKSKLRSKNASDLEVFKKLRDLKDSF